jgi:phosphoribosyl 1,2-cyclic phosphodiesterase
MRFASLGSGSAGNATLIEAGETRLLLDCGFSVKETVTRLARLALSPEQLSGILVTHEHDDHAKGAFKFAAQYQIPVWLTHGTRAMCERYMPAKSELECHVIDGHSDFNINDIWVQPFPVPHDARQPSQFVFGDGDVRLGILTDVGSITPHIVQMLQGCDALMLECNHDVEMLRTGPYAQALKRRVGGDLGHLDNQTTAQLVRTLDTSKLKHMVAAHLSEKNNTPDLAKQALAGALSCQIDWIGVAYQTEGLAWRDIA